MNKHVVRAIICIFGTPLTMALALLSMPVLLPAQARECRISLMETYTRSADVGIYEPAAIGQAIGLTGPAIEYPVVVTRRRLESGALAARFRPLLGKPDAPNTQRTALMALTDENQALLIYILPYALDADGTLTQRLDIVLRNQFRREETLLFRTNLGPNPHTVYHHLLLTWTNNSAAMILDGQSCPLAVNAPALTIPPLDGSALKVELRGDAWFDELLILDRALPAGAAQELQERKIPWVLDAHTAFYAGFDGRADGAGTAYAGGDLIRLITHVGRPDATFRADEPCALKFSVINSTAQAAALKIKGRVRDLNKQVVLEKSVPLQAPAGACADAVFDMSELTANGLFWGDFELQDDARTLQCANIPFARTLAVDVSQYSGDDISTGITAGNSTTGFNPPVYDKWNHVHYEFWRDQEIQPGHWYFERMDLRIANLLHTGRIPIIMLYGTPEWLIPAKYAGAGYSYRKRMRIMPDDLNAWKTYVQTIGTRYRGKVRHYIVWHCEAYFIGAGFIGNSEEQAELVRTAGEILHRIDPSNQVIAAFAGYGDHQLIMAEQTAGFADYYANSNYKFFDRTIAAPETSIYGQQLALLKKSGAKPLMANMEFGVYALGPAGLDEEGFPLTADEVEKRGIWKSLPKVYQDRGKPFPDWHTVAELIVRGTMVDLAAGMQYNLYWSSGHVGGFSDLLYRRHAPSPASVAYANLSGLLAGYRYVKRLNLGSPTLKAYLFQKDGRYLIAAFTDKEDSPVYMELTGNPLRVLDLYGNGVEYETIGPVIKFKLALHHPRYVTGITALPNESRPPLDFISAPGLQAGMECRMGVRLHNPLQAQLHGSLSLQLPFADMTREVRLNDRETREEYFTVKLPPNLTGQYPVDIHFATGHPLLGTLAQCTLFHITPSLNITAPARTPVIDGSLDEWGDPAAFPIQINQAANLIKGVPRGEMGFPRFDWNGPDDLSGAAALAYDDANLYLAISVRDDDIKNIMHRAFPKRAYEGDSVEIFLDARPAQRQANPLFAGEVYHLVVVPPVDNFPARFFHIQKPQDGALPGMVIEAQNQAGKYTIEIKIPWAEFKNIRPATGVNIGFDIGITDNNEWLPDKQTESKSALRWTGANASKDPSLFGRLILARPDMFAR